MSQIKTKRRLKPTNAGIWYLVLTVFFGVVAISSRNNVLYILESLLLATFVLSGILSELAVSGVKLEWSPRATFAGLESNDRIIIINKRRLPLFCLQIGYWQNDQFVPVEFVPYLRGKEHKEIRSKYCFQQRGEFKWEGFVIATKYPFGFALKQCYYSSAGKRIIWPNIAQLISKTSRLESVRKQLTPMDVCPGEIRPIAEGDDCRNIAWLQSFFRNELVTKVRTSTEFIPQVNLDLRDESNFEQKISDSAVVFYHQVQSKQNQGRLKVITQSSTKIIHQANNILNYLAVITPDKTVVPDQGLKMAG